RTAQHDLDAGHELSWAEWFGHVVVGSHGQSDEGVDLLGAGGEHDDIRIGKGAQLAAHFDAVQSRKAEVYHDDVGINLPDQVDCILPVVNDRDVEALAGQIGTDEIGELTLIFDDHRPQPCGRARGR